MLDTSCLMLKFLMCPFFFQWMYLHDKWIFPSSNIVPRLREKVCFGSLMIPFISEVLEGVGWLVVDILAIARFARNLWLLEIHRNLISRELRVISNIHWSTIPLRPRLPSQQPLSPSPPPHPSPLRHKHPPRAHQWPCPAPIRVRRSKYQKEMLQVSVTLPYTFLHQCKIWIKWRVHGTLHAIWFNLFSDISLFNHLPYPSILKLVKQCLQECSRKMLVWIWWMLGARLRDWGPVKILKTPVW